MFCFGFVLLFYCLNCCFLSLQCCLHRLIQQIISVNLSLLIQCWIKAEIINKNRNNYLQTPTLIVLPTKEKLNCLLSQHSCVRLSRHTETSSLATTDEASVPKVGHSPIESFDGSVCFVCWMFDVIKRKYEQLKLLKIVSNVNGVYFVTSSFRFDFNCLARTFGVGCYCCPFARLARR